MSIYNLSFFISSIIQRQNTVSWTMVDPWPMLAQSAFLPRDSELKIERKPVSLGDFLCKTWSHKLGNFFIPVMWSNKVVHADLLIERSQARTEGTWEAVRRTKVAFQVPVSITFWGLAKLILCSMRHTWGFSLSLPPLLFGLN